tara:strand:- start:9368 stop:9847 length:480 start_codon:yes stop_codon:yes gene_type:complete
MAKKKSEKPAEVTDETSHSGGDGSTEPSESAELQAIDANKVYTERQFWKAVGITSKDTQNGYQADGLIIRKAVGRRAKFVLGKDWYDFLNRPENIAKSLDDSEQPSPEDTLQAQVSMLNGCIDELYRSAGLVDVEQLRQDVDELMWHRNNPNFDPNSRE